MKHIFSSRFFRWALLYVALLAVLVWLSWGAGLRFNATASLPRGLYILCPGAPGKGDLVAFCLSGEYAELAKERGYLQAGSCPSGLRPLLKKVAGLPGDYVDTSALCIRTVDRTDRPLASALQDGRIPSGMALVLTPHPGSFDGRYFGLVPLASLQRVRPLFIFNDMEMENDHANK